MSKVYKQSSMKFPKQFLVSSTPFTGIPDWRNIDFLGWHLSIAPEIPVIKVLDRDSVTIGLILGWVLWRGRLLQDGDTIFSHHQRAGLAEEYDELGGRFVHFYIHEQRLAAVTDAAGLMSMVYSADLCLAASTPAIIQQFKPLAYNDEIVRAFSNQKSELWFPFGVTPFHGVRRLLPNHRLTFSDWGSKRIFPLAGGEGLRGNPEVDIESVAVSIAEWVSSNVRALVDAGHNVAHLTGGFDSRMVLAASRNIRHRMQYQMVSMADTRAQLDGHIAANIAKKFALNFRQLDFVSPSKGDINDWLKRTGFCIDDTVATLCTTAKVYDSHCHELTGTCGEAMRTPYWYSDDAQRLSLTPREFMHRFELPESVLTTELTQNWMDSLPTGISVGNLLDIAYIEQRVACWAGPSMYGHDLKYPSISPFSSARYYKAILSIPEAQRAGNTLAPAFIQYLWPELLEIPVNRAHGLAKLRFLSQELRQLLPIEIRDRIKRLLQAMSNTNPGSLNSQSEKRS